MLYKNSTNSKITNRCKIILNDEKKTKYKEFKKFNFQIYKSSKTFKDKLIYLKKKGKKLLDGSPARVSTITNVAKINSNLIDYIIDDSPLKQNRFSPGMHIKILPRKNNINNQIDTVIVFAYEYFNDIKKFFDKNKIEIYKPIPFRKLL